MLVIAEYTIGKPDSAHVLKKKPLYDKIQADVPRFLGVARGRYPDLAKHLKDVYVDRHYKIRIFYGSLREVEQTTIDTCPGIVFLQGG